MHSDQRCELDKYKDFWQIYFGSETSILMPENTGPKQGRFQPGKSGNPAGRPKGSRHAVTLAVEALLDGEAEVITRKAVEAAKAGDMVAIRLVLDRVCPPRKTRPIYINLPAISGLSDIAVAQNEVLRATCSGELCLEDAQVLGGLIEARRRALETAELELRISELENELKP